MFLRALNRSVDAEIGSVIVVRGSSWSRRRKFESKASPAAFGEGKATATHGAVLPLGVKIMARTVVRVSPGDKTARTTK